MQTGAGHARRKGTRRFGVCMQGTDMRTQKVFSTSTLSTSIVLQVVFVVETCTEQTTRVWIVCGSPGVSWSCSTGWKLLRVSPLPVNQLLVHRSFPQICSNASCIAFGTALRGIRRIYFLLAMSLQVLSPPQCAQVEALNLGHQRNATLANGGKQP